jgi:lipopolysaccharide/colanic/teichoic acid biosynthesis glycosyltransferase
MRRPAHIIKRIFDITLACAGFAALFPLIIAIGLVVGLKHGRPVIFKQARPGLNGSLFSIYKFKTMIDKCDDKGLLLPDEKRLTAFGRFLRATSLDELPELVNIIQGDMSFVGPRPLLPRYLNRYTPEQARRHDVKPGLTGWAQVNGRNALAWEDRFKLDIWYVENQSFRLDLKIIALTIRKVIQRENINHAGEATMSEFMGSQCPDEASKGGVC